MKIINSKKQIVCETKNTFDSEIMAIEAIDIMGFKGTQQPYLCDVCKKYHITTSDRNLKSKRDFVRMKKFKVKKASIKKFKI